MFRIESYITPIILRLIQKYVKNLKVQDTHLSLWSGEGVIHNLDLRTSILEDQFGLPFRFVNGHIHELRIAVPWHRITYEPIVITINTMECVLSLPQRYPCDERDSASEQSSVSDNGEIVTTGFKRSVSKHTEDVSPGYLQSLVRKITSNITLVCNNLIMKYVEDDIVLSINVPTLKFCSAGESWRPEFTDFTPPLLFHRKLVHISDLTVCLDLRNSSGRINMYQEPILYRCSFEVRCIMQYSGLYAFRPDVSWISVLCEKLNFSVSDSQLPMVRRLLELCLAYAHGELSDQDAAVSDDTLGSEFPVEAVDNDDPANSSWSEWAWSMIPSTDALFAAVDEDAYKEGKLNEHERVFVLSAHVATIDIDFKYTSGKPVHAQSTPPQTQLKFSSYMHALCQGCFFNYTRCGMQTTKVRSGVSKFSLSPSSLCICGKREKPPYDTTSPYYFEVGCENAHYLSDSLFSMHEVADLRKSFSPSWDSHVEFYSTDRMLSTSPAFSFDYIYSFNLPDDLAADQVSDWDALKAEDVCERSLLRAAIGKSSMSIECGLLHRLDFVVSIVAHTKYAPYKQYEEPSQLLSRKESALEKYITSICSMNIIFIEPSVIVAGSLTEHELSNVKSNSTIIKCKDLSLIMEAPMYSLGSVSYFIHFRSHTGDSNAVCHVHRRFLVSSVCVSLVTPDVTRNVAVLDACSAHQKSVCLPRLWKQYSQPTVEYGAQFGTLQINAGIEVLLHLMSLLGLRYPNHISNEWYNFSLDLCLSSFIFRKMFSSSSVVYVLQFLSLEALIKTELGSKPLRVFSPKVPCSQTTPLFRCVFRHPSEKFSSEVAVVFLIQLLPMITVFHPVMVVWQSLLNHLCCNAGMHRVNVVGPNIDEFNVVSSSGVSSQAKSHVSSKKDTPTKMCSDILPRPHCSKSSKSIRESLSCPISSNSIRTQEKSTSSSRSCFTLQSIRNLVVVIQVGEIEVCLPYCDNVDLSPDSNFGKFTICLPSIYVKGVKDELEWFEGLWLCPEKLLLMSLAANYPLCISLNRFSVDWASCSGGDGKRLLSSNTECTFSLGFSEKTVAVVLHANTAILDVAFGHIQVMSLLKLFNNFVCLLDKYYLSKSNNFPETTGMVQMSSKSLHYSRSLESNDSVRGKQGNNLLCLFGDSISLWIQWTVPRACFNLDLDSYSVSISFEDCAIALDCQNVFRKIKLVIGSCNTLLNSADIFRPFDKGLSDVIFTSCPRAKRDLKMKSLQEIRSTLNSTDDDVMVVGASLIQSSPAEPKSWLNFTFTKAMRSDVLKRWGQQSNVSEKNDIECLSEVEVKLTASDFVLTSNFIHSAHSFLTSICELTRFFQKHERSTPGPICSSSLPLIYIDMETLRIFLSVNDRVRTVLDDVIILQITSMSVQLSFEFPLSRPILLPHLYEKAQFNGSCQTPGSEIEERQYQVDISEVFVASANWSQLEAVSIDVRPSVQHGIVTMGENPAVDWNNFDPSRTATMRALLPIIDTMSARLVFAPAIVINNEDKSSIVAGYGVDLNIISNVILSISTHQMELVLQIARELLHSTNVLLVSENCSMLSSHSTCDSKTTPPLDSTTIVMQAGAPKDEGVISADSGVESDCVARKIEKSANQESVSETVVPCEIVCNFNCMSCYIFDDQHSSKLVPASPSTNSNISNQVLPKYYLRMSQPQVTLKWCLNEFTYQVSTYDLCLKTFRSHRTSRCCQLIPDLSCYGEIIAETKSSANEDLAGISPIVLEFLVEKKLTNDTAVSIRVCRPLHLSWDQSKQQTALEFIGILSRMFFTDDVSCQDSGTIDVDQTSFLDRILMLIKYYAQQYRSFRLFLFEAFIQYHFDFVPTDTLCVSLNSVCFESRFDDHGSNASQCLDIKTTLDKVNFFVLTSDVSLQFLSFCDLSLNLDLVWQVSCNDPLVIFRISSDFSSIDFGPKQIEFVTKISTNACTESETASEISGSKHANEGYPPAISEDDLRKRVFTYVVGNETDKCGVDQILFDKKAGSMTWRYPEDRFLKKLLISPVPFVNSSNLDCVENSNLPVIRCDIQCFDRLLRRFVTLCEFDLSESETTNVELPLPIETRKAPSSDLWRIRLDINKKDASAESPQMLCPTALASCVCVNSESNYRVIPKMRSALSVGCLEILLHTGRKFSVFPRSERMSLYSNEIPPSDVIVSKVVFDSANMAFEKWYDAEKLVFDGSVSLSTINSTFFADVPIFEKCGFKVDILRDQRVRPTHFDVTTVMGDLEFYFNPIPIVCLINSVQQCVEQFQNGDVTSSVIPIVKYILINNTGSPLILGQANTEESILLHSMCQVQYSWFSPHLARAMVVGIPSRGETIKSDLSDPFAIDTDAIFSRNLKMIDKSFGLIISITKLSPVQKVIKLEGRLQVWNLIDDCLSVHFDTFPFSQLFSIEPHGQSPSVLCDDASVSIACEKRNQTRLNYVEIDLLRNEPCLLKLAPTCHVWCHLLAENHDNVLRQVVVFSPVFSIKSLLPSPVTICYDANQTIFENKGKGTFSALQLEPSSTHYLTLKTDNNSEPSNPPLPVSTSHLDQCENIVIVNSIESAWMQVSQSKSSWLPAELDDFKNSLVIGNQSKIQLHASYERRWPWLNTLALKIHASTMVVNLTNTDMVFRSGKGDFDDVYISSFGISASSYEEGIFFIGIIFDDLEYQSKPLQLGRYGWLYERALPSFQGVVPSEGSAKFNLFVNQYFCSLCMRTCRFLGIQWIMIHPGSVVFNNAPFDVYMTPIACSWSPGTNVLPCAKGVDLASSCASVGHELIWWNLADGIPPEPTTDDAVINYLLDFSGCQDSPIAVEGKSGSFSVNGSQECSLLTVSYLENNNQYLIYVEEDLAPFLIVENDTANQVFVRMLSCDDSTLFKFIGGRSPYSVVSGGRRCFPSPRNVKQKDDKQVSNLLLSLEDFSESSASRIDLAYGHSQYLRVNDSHFSASVSMMGPTFVVKIQEVIGATFNVTLVRDRLKQFADYDNESYQLKPVREPAKTISTADIEAKSSSTLHKEDDRTENIQFTMFLHKLSIVLCDEINRVDVVQEVIRVTADHVALTVFPDRVNRSDNCPSSLLMSYSVSLSIGDVQVDNQLPMDYSHHNFDVLIKFDTASISDKSPLYCRSPIELTSLLNHLRRNSVISLNCSIDVDPLRLWRLRNLRFSALPFEAYIDDKGITSFQIYLSSLILLFNEFFNVVPTECDASVQKSSACYRLPSEFLIEVQSLCRKVHIDHLKIDPIKMTLNVQIKMKLHLSIIESPVNLALFEKHNINSSYHVLLSELLQFYIWSAMYKTGSVVSSLDLLGDPGGFARSLSRGVKDLVELPYRGIVRGPLGFVIGCVSGMLSLGGHVTSATLNSLVSFSSGLARNIDVLTLDSEHAERSAIERRSAGRAGVINGVAHGLTGLGMSLLSAVAGLADQPIQGALHAGTASAVISGVGRGLAGVVTKPLGGAVDLVTYTGRGILYATGWKHKLTRRNVDGTHLMADYPPSSLWFSRRFTRLGAVLSLREAAFTSGPKRLNVYVLITDSFICLVDAQPSTELIFQHEIPYVELMPCAEDPDLLLLLDYSDRRLARVTTSGSGCGDDGESSVALNRCDNYVQQCLRQKSLVEQTEGRFPVRRVEASLSSPNIIWSVFVGRSASSALLTGFHIARDLLPVK